MAVPQQAPRLYTFDLVLTANQRVTLPLHSEFLYIQEATGAINVYVGSDNNKARLAAGLQYRCPPGQAFERFDIEDASGAGNTIRIAYGFGEFEDNRLALASGASIAVAANSGIATTADAALAAGVLSAIVAAKNNRRSIALKNVGANVCRVGDAVNTAAGRGHELQPGESIVLTTTAAISGFSTVGTTISIVEETA